MNELNRNRSFADTGGHSLYRTVAHIAHSEDARDIRF